MRIVLDAMGSDNFPAPDVEGAVLAATEYGETVVLVGDESRIKAELNKHQTAGLSLEVVHADQLITMEDKPSEVTRSKPNSSMHIGLGLVDSGQADAFVSCGNTGAVLSIATIQKVRRIRGIHRPALTSIVPFRGNPIVLLDLGANVDSRPEWLCQFAIMGKIYAELGLGLNNPRVALLSNGEEEGKGYSLIHETTPLLRKLNLNYVGNVEPKEVVKGIADVIVCDGFVGNIFAKTLEAMGATLFSAIRDSIKGNLRATLGAALLKPTFINLYRSYDPSEIGGAPLLGLNGVVIIGHGRSDAKAVKNAIRQARDAVKTGLVSAIREGIAEPTKA